MARFPLLIVACNFAIFVCVASYNNQEEECRGGGFQKRKAEVCGYIPGAAFSLIRLPIHCLELENKCCSEKGCKNEEIKKCCQIQLGSIQRCKQGLQKRGEDICGKGHVFGDIGKIKIAYSKHCEQLPQQCCSRKGCTDKEIKECCIKLKH